MVQFLNKQQAIKQFNLSSDTLKKYRREGDWIEGIHWVRINSRCIRYNLTLIQDWLHNRQNPHAHLQAIKAYEATLLSYQVRSKKHPPKNS